MGIQNDREVMAFSSWKGWPGRYYRVLSKPPLVRWVQAVPLAIVGFHIGSPRI